MKNRKKRQNMVIKATGIYGRNTKKICEWAGIHHSTFYEWMKDAEFKARYDAVIFQLADIAREKLLSKAFDFNDTNAMIALLKYDRIFNVSEEQISHWEGRMSKARAKHGKRYSDT